MFQLSEKHVKMPEMVDLGTWMLLSWSLMKTTRNWKSTLSAVSQI